jgi:hypothetical protein
MKPQTITFDIYTSGYTYQTDEILYGAFENIEAESVTIPHRSTGSQIKVHAGAFYGSKM